MQLRREVEKIEAATQKIREFLPRIPEPRIIRNVFLYALAGSLVLVYLLMIITNFLFDLYFTVPEIPKYLKVSGSQVALEVNEKVDQDFQ